MTTVLINKGDTYILADGPTVTTTNGEPSEESLALVRAQLGADVYDIARRRIAEGIGLAYPARKVLDLED